MNRLISGIACFATTSLLISAVLLVHQSPQEGYKISGRVSYDDTVPNLRSVNMAADADCMAMNKQPVANPMLSLGSNKALANVFVSISNPPKGNYPIPDEPVIIEFKHCMCVPRVVAAMIGQEVKFLNSDGILHNAYGQSEVNRQFNIGMPSSLKEKSMIFSKVEGMFPIKSNVHSWEKAYLAILDHPFYDVTGADGTFELPDLPNGTYDIIAWHERLPRMKGTITISEKDASIDFSFKIPKRN